MCESGSALVKLTGVMIEGDGSRSEQRLKLIDLQDDVLTLERIDC